MIQNRANNVANWPFDKLVVVLLRQFRRLLAERGVDLTDSALQRLAEQAAERVYADPVIPAARVALIDIVQGSLAKLAEWKLTFAGSLRTAMTDLPWETTADFLDVANEKVNAEIRISAGSALLLIMGEAQFGRYPLEAVQYDLEAAGELDVDAVIARRALLFAAGTAEDDPAWLALVEQWVSRNAPSDIS